MKTSNTKRPTGFRDSDSDSDFDPVEVPDLIPRESKKGKDKEDVEKENDEEIFPENVKQNILEFLVPDGDETNTSNNKTTMSNDNSEKNNGENTKKRKEPPPAVTPEREKKKQDYPPAESQQGIQAFFPNALKASVYLKHFDGSVPVLDTLKNAPYVLYCKDVSFGLFTLYYVDFFGSQKEGNVWPILAAHGCVRYNRSISENMHQFVADAGLLAISPRRANRSSNDPIYKRSAADPAAKYKEVVFVKAFANNNSLNKHRLAATIVKFLCDSGVETEAKRDLDQTDPKIQSLDHYLRDEDIIRLIERFWKGKVDKTFYGNCAEVRDAFFSEPYSEAAQALGYPRSASVDFNTEEDEQGYVDMTEVD